MRRFWAVWRGVLIIDDSLQKDAPNWRPAEQRLTATATAISLPRLSVLQHLYAWREAAQLAPAVSAWSIGYR